MEAIDVWDLIEAAADAWGEAPSNITIEVMLKSAAIRSKRGNATLFEKVAPDEPGRRVDAIGALRRGIALKFAERAAKLAVEVTRSRRNADHWDAQARALAERAEKLDPNYLEFLSAQAEGTSAVARVEVPRG